MANSQSQCKECGCKCSKCSTSDHDVHLHVEIENLKQRLVEREHHIATMESNFLNEANKFPNGEFAALQDELLTWQDKYRRLYDAHRRVQRVNQGLEDKLLRLVDVCETEKTTLTKDVAVLSHRLAEANYTIKKLTEDNERYKDDVALAIQFLQCKQSNFVSQKLDSLPNEVQAKVSSYVASKRKPEEKKPISEMKSIKVPIPTFPPTAMVYSIPKSSNSDKASDKEPESPVDIVSAAIMAKVLEERERERSCAKHCDTCTCSRNLKIVHDITHHNIGTQTGEYKTSLCLRCNNDMVKVAVGMRLVKQPEINRNRPVPIYTHEVDIARGDFESNLLKSNGEVHTLVIKESGSFKGSNSYSGTNSDQLRENNSHTRSLSDTSSLHSREKNGHIPGNINVNTLIENRKSVGSCNKIMDKKNSLTLSHSDSYKKVSSRSVELKEIDFSSVQHSSCDHSAQSFQIELSSEEKCDLEKAVDKASAKQNAGDASQLPETLKGPRYCSVRVQSGSKNILLDNIHNNVPPVLYTHPTDKKHKKEDYNLKVHETSSKTSTPVKPADSNVTTYNSSRTESCSSEERKLLNIVDDASIQNQQRVAEWIQNNQNNVDNDPSSSDNSRCDSIAKSDVLSDIDRVKYAEMEKNVKKFLFGESQSTEKHSRSNSHTETDI